MNTYDLQPLDERQRYAIDEACAYLRISRSKLYQKIVDKELSAIKDGHRTFISGAEIARLSVASVGQASVSEDRDPAIMKWKKNGNYILHSRIDY